MRSKGAFAISANLLVVPVNACMCMSGSMNKSMSVIITPSMRYMKIPYLNMTCTERERETLK